MIMSRTANVFARVEPEIKEQAESVLEQLGIPMSNAVSMFLRQIVLQRGIPFEMKLPRKEPLAIGSLTKEQFDAEIEKGIADVKAGRVYSAEKVLPEPDTAAGQTQRIMDAILTLNNMPMRHTLYEDEPWHSLGLRYLPVDNYVIYPLAFTPALFPIRKNENTFCCALYVYVETAAWQSPAFFFAQNYNLWEQRC